MTIKERLGAIAKVASGKAKQTYSHIRLDMRIKEYEKEIEQTKAAIGEMVYSAWCSGEQVNQPTLDDHFEGIRTIENRLVRLNKRKEAGASAGRLQISDDTIGEDNARTLKDETAAFTKLKKKENDLRVGRIQGGIGVLRHCPACSTPNSLQSVTCEKCTGKM